MKRLLSKYVKPLLNSTSSVKLRIEPGENGNVRVFGRGWIHDDCGIFLRIYRIGEPVPKTPPTDDEMLYHVTEEDVETDICESQRWQVQVQCPEPATDEKWPKLIAIAWAGWEDREDGSNAKFTYHIEVSKTFREYPETCLGNLLRLLWLYKFGFRWDQLRRIGNTRTAKLVVLLPPLAFVLSYIAPGLEWINAHLSPIDLFLLRGFFVGLVALALGNVLYAVLCPTQVNMYDDDVQYVLQENGAIWQGEPLALATRIPKASRWYVKEDEDQVKQIRYYYRYLCETVPFGRVTVSILYGAGLFLLILPTIIRITMVLETL